MILMQLCIPCRKELHGQNIERSADFSGLSSAQKLMKLHKGSACAPNKGEPEPSLVEAFLF